MSHEDHDIHGAMVIVYPSGYIAIDEDCDCPPGCEQCADEEY
jgi:hypothetical protein